MERSFSEFMQKTQNLMKAGCGGVDRRDKAISKTDQGSFNAGKGSCYPSPTCMYQIKTRDYIILGRTKQ